MIVACAKAGRVERALSIFHDMESSPLFFLQRKSEKRKREEKWG